MSEFTLMKLVSNSNFIQRKDKGMFSFPNDGEGDKKKDKGTSNVCMKGMRCFKNNDEERGETCQILKYKLK